MPNEPIVLRGDVRRPGADSVPGVVTLGPDGLSVALGGEAPWAAAYRDVAKVMLDAGVVMIVLGDESAAERWLFERFGSGLARLARGLRDGRLRQWLTDGLVELSNDVEIDLVEYATETTGGIAQLLYHDLGVALAPLDERPPRLRIRRAAIGSIVAHPEVAGIRVTGASGGALAPGADGPRTLELLRLGSAVSSHRERWAALRDGAAADVSAIVGALLADAPLGVREHAAAKLTEGRPASRTELGDAWPIVERAVLAEPAFAESYRMLVDRSAGEASERWLAIAPDRAGAPDPTRIWFFVALPGNLVAMELVSADAHATYLFRVVRRAEYSGGSADAGRLAAAVDDVSEALVDSRFLREPMALPSTHLAQPQYLRYRLALAALPSLSAARSRFVARLVHRDPVSWAAALDDLIRWHGSSEDDAAEWPGRATEESQIDEAGAAGS